MKTDIRVAHPVSIFTAEVISYKFTLNSEIPSALKMETVMVSPYNTIHDETHKTTM
jgi:hypothetical protein